MAVLGGHKEATTAASPKWKADLGSRRLVPGTEGPGIGLRLLPCGTCDLRGWGGWGGRRA